VGDSMFVACLLMAKSYVWPSTDSMVMVRDFLLLVLSVVVVLKVFFFPVKNISSKKATRGCRVFFEINFPLIPGFRDIWRLLSI